MMAIYCPIAGGWWWLPLGLMGIMMIVCILMCRRMGCMSMMGRCDEIPPPGQAPPAQTPRESPLDILDRRYAAGEIGRDEYLRMKGDMGR